MVSGSGLPYCVVTGTVCLKGTAMGQTWEVFNIDRREKDLAGGAKLGEFFFDDMTSLYESLRIPRLPKAMDEWLSRGTRAVQPGPMGKLSTELLDMVFEDLLDDPAEDPTDGFLDCIILAISCKRLLSVGARHVLRGLISRHARAADCRLICLGEYADGDDQAPPGMLTDAEVKEIATTEGPDEDCYDTIEEAVRAARCLYIFALESYKPRSAANWTLFEPLRKVVEGLRTARRKDPGRIAAFFAPRDLDMIAALGAVGYYRPELEYAEGSHVLCNMSKGECVREDTLVVWELGRRRITLAHALLSRICYSPDNSISMECGEEYLDGLVKGPWVGDRFRITSADEMPPLKGGKEWKDVTKDVNRLLRHLLRHEFPEKDCETEDDEKVGGGAEKGENQDDREELDEKNDGEKKED
ncbi:hypothetical protein V8D89_003813 [Ganoderma adspersum]